MTHFFTNFSRKSHIYCRKVIIWQEISGRWQKSYEWACHEASTTSVAFAPHQYGLWLASSSADGDIGILRYDSVNGQWQSSKIQKCHEQGVNSVSWAPGSADPTAKKRLVSAGNDKCAKIWVLWVKIPWKWPNIGENWSFFCVNTRKMAKNWRFSTENRIFTQNFLYKSRFFQQKFQFLLWKCGFWTKLYENDKCAKICVLWVENDRKLVKIGVFRVESMRRTKNWWKLVFFSLKLYKNDRKLWKFRSFMRKIYENY